MISSSSLLSMLSFFGESQRKKYILTAFLLERRMSYHFINKTDIMPKAIIAIDGGYFIDGLNRYLYQATGKNLDVVKFSNKVCEDSGVTHLRTKFYHSNPYKSPDATTQDIKRYAHTQKMFDSINQKKNHEVVRVGRVKPANFSCPGCKLRYKVPKQKGVDVAMALDLVKMSQNRVADVFIIVSGDEDLTAAIEMVKESLSQVIVYFSSDSNGVKGSVKLNGAADDRKQMDLDFLEECATDY